MWRPTGFFALPSSICLPCTWSCLVRRVLPTAPRKVTEIDAGNLYAFILSAIYDSLCDLTVSGEILGLENLGGAFPAIFIRLRAPLQYAQPISQARPFIKLAPSFCFATSRIGRHLLRFIRPWQEAHLSPASNTKISFLGSAFFSQAS